MIFSDCVSVCSGMCVLIRCVCISTSDDSVCVVHLQTNNTGEFVTIQYIILIGLDFFYLKFCNSRIGSEIIQLFP